MIFMRPDPKSWRLSLFSRQIKPRQKRIRIDDFDALIRGFITNKSGSLATMIEAFADSASDKKLLSVTSRQPGPVVVLTSISFSINTLPNGGSGDETV